MGKLDGRGMWNSLLLLSTLFATCYSQNIPVIKTSLVTLSEELSPGDFAFKIEAYDLDNDPLTYAITEDNGIFSVNANTGDVYLRTKLDRETNQLFTVLASVSDGILEPTKRRINIVVNDTNDNKPTFINGPYNINIPENTAVGTTVFVVTATDPDDGPAGTVSYKFDKSIPVEGLSVFSISRKGDVVLDKALNFTEKSPFYQLQINATDGGGPYSGNPNFVQWAVATAFITVVDIPDLNPQFLNLPNTARVMEHSSVGTSVFTVVARDPDTGINDIISYTIEDSSVNGLFQIESDTGIVRVMSDIDREALMDIEAIVKLTVKATEANLNVNGIHASTTSTLSIQIDDLNDKPPLFYKCEGDVEVCIETRDFSGEVDEHASVGLSITGLNMRVKDADAGENSRFQLHLEGTDKDAFSVSPKNDMSDRVVQILIKDPAAIDYEKKQTMIVQVVATDVGEPKFVSTATVTIKIKDINDNIPKFVKDTYELTVPENCENGTILETITATDEDALDNNKLTYTLLPDNILLLFNVYTTNGSIYVKNGKELDRERRNLYFATLQAKDSVGNVGTTVLEITVDDVNDQTPQFLQNPYQVFIRENNVLNTYVEAQDNDEPGTPNSAIKYGIEPGEYSSNFTINKDTGELTSKGALDREAIDVKLKGVITLNITATDMGIPALSSWVKFIINVDDENDNSPVFLKSEYTFSVNESLTGAFVGFVYATDADQTEYNNRISFRIISGSGGTFLCVSEPDGADYRGKIMVDPDVALDYESENKKYTLTVEATDLNNNAATCMVDVVVEDVNDTPPSFPSGITFRVEENTVAGTEIGKIVASDLDTHHFLVYELVSFTCLINLTWVPCKEQWFDLKSNGAVMTAEGITIDYEECPQVKMTARVVDLYTEKGRNGTEGVVLIDIIDVNDNVPEFIPVQEFFVLISENIDQDKSVARVYAKDRDSGDNKKIEFKVTLVQFASNNPEDKPQPTNLIFYAETEQPDVDGNYKGIIKSTNILEADKQGKYLVTVTANNGILSTNEILELVTVDKTYKVGLRFDSSVFEVNENLPYIRGALSGATKAMVHIVKVSPASNDATRKVMTLLEAYFVYLNGTALDSDDVGKILNSQEVYEEYGVVLQQYGLTSILASTEKPQENNTVLFIMLGLVAGLVIVLVVTTTSMVCIRKKYKTKLKAAKAMNTATMEATEYQKDGPVVPGTNKYTREGANPVLNLNIDASTDLGFDEEASSAERDSLNSLDYNMDMTMTDKDTMALKSINEDEEYGDNSSYIEPLGAALAQRGRKKVSQGVDLTFDNPSLDMTDL
ncbi:cadherin-related family member 2 [Tachysurus fulvidraco]|uniref:cadherin-related family member 2 n=1 Tax=Tachysurus fulvidraco TaxID=1234273 RepID=UPI001FEE79C6|nr:cadherin-related family member 2 [Tachysurus fulvidraco]